jgi:ATP-dependent DNA helicase RecG
VTDEASGAPRPVGRRLGQLATLPVDTLRGVGPRKAAALGAMGIETVFDLLTHYPRRYADRTTAVAIGALEPGVEGVISGRIRRVDIRRPRGRAGIVTVVIEDETGLLTVRFFNQPWRARQLGEGMGVVVFGRVDAFRGELQMVNPIVDLVGDRTGRIVPIYPQSEKAGVGSNELATYIAEALERAGAFAEPLPPDALARFGLVERTDAFRSIHLPERSDAWPAARRRLAFDELFRLQLSLVLRRRAVEATARGIVHPVVKALAGGLVSQFIGQLPFPLTGAQERVIREVANDLASPLPMHRLLQGDVGSGKTVVALAALLFAVDGDRQGALMVPTEVLAEQHFLLARGLVAGMAIPDPDRLGGSRPPEIALLTSRTPQSRRARLLSRLRTGQIDLLVGTHALLTDDVAFRALGVVVIDEQHRFGVDQRAALREKGTADGAPVDPDVLVMTATPIPRTAAMTVYGDLDQSTLDELPAGRAPTKTVVLSDEDEDVAWSAVLAEVANGRQAFVICPLVRPGAAEATEDAGPLASDADPTLFIDPDDRPRRPPRNAVDELARLSSGPLGSARVGLLHGQLPPKEKERVMEAFRRGDLDVLVATTVIEVGVDVPNATVVVIEDADRFGIAQLHQLRGRVGRGDAPARCYLIADRPTDDGERRLGALAATTDGFELAEVDLELRGEGTVLGIRQKGRSDLRLASLRRDRDLIVAARTVATAVIDADPELTDHPLLAEELEVLLGAEAEYLHRN